jgi:outer membrane protein OmpA-like peptidoglycan-associated protein
LLEKLSQALASERLSASRFRVEGHTDAKGTAAYNRALSHRRAQAVVAYLADRGVASARLSSVGMGFDELLLKDQPFAADNRRVRIVAME